MQEHEYTAPPTHNVPVTTVSPTKRDRAMGQHSPLSSPFTWLSLATLIVAVIAYLFLAPLPAATQSRSTPEEVPAPR